MLFASTVEAALLEFTGECDMERMLYGVKKFRDEWYKGDAMYGDGVDFHMDYYNSFVIHPMLTDVLVVMKKHNIEGADFLDTQLKRHARYAEILERFISPEGSFPVVGRSICYRFGAFHALGQAAFIFERVKPAQVRCALTSVIRRQLKSPANFDKNGWLRRGANRIRRSVYFSASGLRRMNSGLPLIRNGRESKTNYELRYAAHPEDAKQYDTKRIRRDFLIEKVFTPNEVNMVYSMYDRMIVGGAMPAGEVLVLEAIDPLKAPYFLTRREMGIFNVGGPGVVKAGDAVFELDYKEALYLGSGDREVTFESKDVKNPAQFYFNSVTAHRNYPDKKVTKADAIVAEMGSLSNHRTPCRHMCTAVVWKPTSILKYPKNMQFATSWAKWMKPVIYG